MAGPSEYPEVNQMLELLLRACRKLSAPNWLASICTARQLPVILIVDVATP
jgi:hypothetical protein